MTALLLAYSATAYLFSGSVCYLAFLNRLDNDPEIYQQRYQPSKLTNIWIALLWPFWVIGQVKAEDSTPLEAGSNSSRNRPLSSTGTKNSDK